MDAYASSGYGEDLARTIRIIYLAQPNPKLEHFTPQKELADILKTHPKDTASSGLNYPSMIAAEIRRQGGREHLEVMETMKGSEYTTSFGLTDGGLGNLNATSRYHNGR